MLTLYSNGQRARSLLDWDPLRLFVDSMSWEPAAPQTGRQPYAPPATLETTDDGAKITVDMPGVEPADVEITFASGQLSLAGKRGEQTYRYTVALGDTIDADHIDASLDKGVLTVYAPRKLEARPRKIQLRAATSTKSLGTGHENE